MKITVVGTGYVGLVTATCLASSGNHVIGVDIDPKKVQALSSGQCTIYEPGLSELLQANLTSGRLQFTTDLSAGVSHGQVVFIAVGTPPRPDGSADLSGVEKIVRDVASIMTSSKVVVIKSTVPVGTGRRMSAIMEEQTAHPFAVVSNPEFLKEGAALDDFLRPDRVVIGTDDKDAIQLLSELYAPFVRTRQTILVMSREAAEMVKYASNAYLATRISFINEIADICAHTGVDINQVRQGMGADQRIGQAFLYPGMGTAEAASPRMCRPSSRSPRRSAASRTSFAACTAGTIIRKKRWPREFWNASARTWRAKRSQCGEWPSSPTPTTSAKPPLLR